MVQPALLQPHQLLSASARSLVLDQNKAKWWHERLVRRVQEFENGLSAEEEVGGRLVNVPGPEGFFHIEDISYWGPDMIEFIGKGADGSSLRLLQHVSQTSVLLVAVPKEKEEPRRIGFHLARGLPPRGDD